MATLVLTDLQKAALGVAFLDAMGNPAAVEGPPVWASSDETLVTVTAAEDGLSAVATTVGPLGSCQVSVVADADLGAGVENITGTLDVTVVADKATSVAISTGTPEPR